MTGHGGGMTFSELFDLPLVVDVRTAARVLGICPNTAYRLIEQGDFPCPVLRPGWQYRVPTAGLLRALEIQELPVHADDVQRGAAGPADAGERVS